MLGRALVAELVARGERPVELDRPEFDLTEESAVRRLFEDARASVVFNAAAYTDVDGAETEPEAAERVNARGVRCLGEAAARAGVLVVHFGTDYVFDGASRAPYTEDDAPSPLNAYARTKLAGEEALARSGAAHLTIRTAWLFAPWGGNFVLGVLERARRLAAGRGGEPLRVVDDQRGSPTYAPDLARGALDLVGSGARGTYHLVNSGEATWRELAVETCRLAGLGVEVARAATQDIGAPAKRPAYSVLSAARAERLIGRAMRHWCEALAECVRRI